MPLIPPCTVLLLVDLQERLVPAVAGHAAMIANARLLAQGADLLGRSIIATEQYPKGLGPTLPGLLPNAASVFEKTTFDALATQSIANRLAGANSIVVMGCEAHVCVLQTVLSLRAAGKLTFVVADATGARTIANHQAALGRMAAHGAEIVTTEMVLFEWLGASTHPQFRTLSARMK
jgi:nicotinamidase-related amidase